jgi:hypothetical protein
LLADGLLVALEVDRQRGPPLHARDLLLLVNFLSTSDQYRCAIEQMLCHVTQPALAARLQMG